MINNLDFSITTVRPPMVETKNGIMLMKQYYTKEQLSPISFSGWENITSGSNTINTVACCHLNTSIRQGFRHQEFGVTLDPYVDNRYYFNINNHHSNQNAAYSYTVHSTEQENDFLVHAITTMPKNLINYKIVDIDENYVYIITKHINGSGTYLCRVNRSGGVDYPLYINPSARAVFTKIYSDERYIFLCCRNHNAQWQFYRYDKTTNTYTTKMVDHGNGANGGAYAPVYQCVMHENVYHEGNIYYVYQMYQYGTQHSMLGIKIDITKDVTAAGNLTFFYPMSYQAGIKNNVHNDYELHRFWVMDGYLYYMVYDEDYVAGYLNSIAVQGIHTFKILSGGKLEYVGYNQIDVDEQIISMAFSSTRRVLIIGFWTSFMLMRYDDNTKQYKLVSAEHYDNVATVGFDEYDRLWVLRPNNALEMFSTNDPQETTIRFQYPMYTYTGMDIQSFVEFKALTFIGEYAKGMYRFELTGTAHFANGDQSINIEYKGSTQEIPIVVTGSDQLTCKVYYIKGGD